LWGGEKKEGQVNEVGGQDPLGPGGQRVLMGILTGGRRKGGKKGVGESITKPKGG